MRFCMGGLVADCANSSVLAMESTQSCAKPLMLGDTDMTKM